MREWTNDEVLSLVEAFRHHGPNFAAVGRAAGVDRRTVKRAWEKGLKPVRAWNFTGTPPIRDILKDTQVRARAALATQDALVTQDQPAPRSMNDELRAMRDDIMEARIRSGRVIRIAKANLQRAMPGLSELVAVTSDLAVKVATAIRDAGVVLGAAQAGEMSVGRAMYMVKDVAQLQRDFLESLKLLQDMERLELGEPTEIIGHKITMSDEDARQFMLDAKAAFETIDVEAYEPKET